MLTSLAKAALWSAVMDSTTVPAAPPSVIAPPWLSAPLVR
jgi:hypothetical protein